MGLRPDELVRDLAPHVLGALVRRGVSFDEAEDAVQEALLAAVSQWPTDGVPDNPTGWLVRVASRRAVDHARSERARLARELRVATAQEAGSPALGASAGDVQRDGERDGERDDTVALLVLCAHPALSRASQVALTLRAVGGLSTAQVARGFLVPEATMAQRISRAKATLAAAGARFAPPTRDEVPERVGAVLQVLGLVFTEGHTSTDGPHLHDVALTGEAIRLARRVHAAFPLGAEPADVAGEVAGLLALMLLTEARATARSDEDGALVPLEEQDRSRWDRALVEEGLDLVTRALSAGAVGPFQLQAAIAAVHAEASSWEQTDWLQILVLYRTLDRIAPSATVTLNLAVAVSMVHGPASGLRTLEPLLADARLARLHRLHAVRAHLLERSGDVAAAADAYERAAELTTNIPEQQYLNARRQRLDEKP